MSDKAAYHGFVAPLIAGIRLSNQQNNKDLETACTLWGLRAGAAFQGKSIGNTAVAYLMHS